MFLTQFLICLGLVIVPDWGESLWLVLSGTILVITGITAEFWIRYRYLGRFWSGSVEIKKEHQIIEKGPYQIIRHPLYAVNLAIYPGAVLTFAVWWNWIACIMVTVGYVLLALYEDGYLEANLPGYREYQKRTPYRFIPELW